MKDTDKKISHLLPAALAWYAKHEGVPVGTLTKDVDMYYKLLKAHEQYPVERTVFRNMKKRATNPDARHRKNGYAERGICEEWCGTFGFLAFLEDVGPMPSYEKENGHNKWTLDRIDNSKGYYPGNCRWATYTQQIRNRSNTRKVQVDGEELLLADALKRFNMSSNVYTQRVRHGWSELEALTTPVGARRK